MHGVNFLVMAVDMIVCRQVFRLAHGVYFFAYCLLYLLWSGLALERLGVGSGPTVGGGLFFPKLNRRLAF